MRRIDPRSSRFVPNRATANARDLARGSHRELGGIGFLLLLATLFLLVPDHATAQAAPAEGQEQTPKAEAMHGDSDESQHTCNHGGGEGAQCPMHGSKHGTMGGDGQTGTSMGSGGDHHGGVMHGRSQSAEHSGPGRRGGRGMGGMRGMDQGNHNVMRTAMTLVHQHRDAIEREVEDIPNGVVTTTWSALDPEAARTLERHVVEMKAALDKGQTVRGWDPLFAEIFQHYDEIEMLVEPIEGGVRVTETSENPEVVKLIQAHARKVNEFLARGPAAAHEETPLPEGYVDTRPQR